MLTGGTSSTTTLKAVLVGEDKSMSKALGGASGAVDDLDKKGGKLSGTFGSIGSTFASLGIAGIVAGAGTAVVSFLGDSITAASDLNETINKSNVIFGKNAGAIEKWGSTAYKNLGLSKNEAMAAAAQFGDMFLQLGFTSDAATDMAKDVVQLSADLGSFNNLPTADVAERISAAFRGEYDSLQLLIPNINAARVEQEALAQTHKKSAKELTAAEKATAVLSIVQKDGARAAGDFAKTSDGLANQQKILSAAFEDTKAEVGQSLLPILNDLGKWLVDEGIPAVKDATKWWNEHGDDVQSVARVIGKAVMVLGQAQVTIFKAIGGAISGVMSLWTALWNNAAYPVISKLIAGVGAMARHWAGMLRGMSKVPGFGWAAGAAAKLEAVADGADTAGRMIQRIPNKKSVTISASTGKAIASIGALQLKIRRTNGKTVTVKVRYVTEGRLPNGGVSILGGLTRAAGGPVFGPGTETSDSIPTLLSNNEHVWSAAEVRAAGGHQVMEGWRRAARSGQLVDAVRRAQGGAVGQRPASAAALSAAGVSGMGGGDLVVNVRTTLVAEGRQLAEVLQVYRKRSGQPLRLEETTR